MVQSVERALMILDILDKDKNPDEGIGVLALSKAMNLKFPTVHNLLKTLVTLGYAEQIEHNGKYRLGALSMNLGQNFANRKSLIQASELPVIKLRDDLFESVMLVAKIGDECQVLLNCPSLSDLTVRFSVASISNFYTLATGRMVLANMTNEELNTYTKRNGFPCMEWDGINNSEKLRLELDLIRQNGYAQCQKPDIIGLAMPIFIPGRKLNAALGVSVPAIRFNAEKKAMVLETLGKTIFSIIQRLTI